MAKKEGAGSELDPGEIRRIRVSLGLTQVEAGELLGGGPRAFSKYESGQIKPSASVGALLRLLDANPTAISTLTGKRAQPIDSAGSRPFQVNGEHVAALNERKFVLLIRKLLNAEAHDSGLSKFGVHVASNITAADGGEDGRIEWQGGPQETEHLPSRLCLFQMKAGEISPAEAASDVQQKSGEVKEMVRSVLTAGGTYIMLCSRPYTKKLIEKRRRAIYSRLVDQGVKVTDQQVHFLDADQIADWANDRPTVATWLLGQTQPGVVGPFKDWSHWAGRTKHDNSPWITDDRFSGFRHRLRELISPTMGIARVIGPWGAGKSRLTLEALGPTETEEKSGYSLSDSVLYSVLSEVGDATTKSGVQALVDSGVRAVVVIDKCDRETHNDVAAMVKRGGSKTSLVTIDHEFTNAERELDDRIFVEAASDDVVSKVLDNLLPELPSEDQRRLLKFSRGYPGIAQLLAEAWIQNIPIASASDEDLVSRIVVGRRAYDPILLESVARLTGAFALIGYRPPLDSDLDEIARHGRNLTADDIRAGMSDLIDRGVCERRGRLVTLQPRPIALSLAAAQWRSWSPAQWEDVLFGSSSPHLRLRAASQLALLNTQPQIAHEVTQHCCRPDGPFSSLDDLIEEHNSEILSSLAEIDAEAVSTLLDRLLSEQTKATLLTIAGDARRNLVRTLEKVAFLSESFERGARLLLDLAVAENETWGNNAQGQFKALFPSLLADTQAGADKRLALLDDELQSEDSARLLIVTEALLEGAKVRSFTRSVGSETHGTRPTLEPWLPKTWGDAWDYVSQCGDRLAQLSLRDDQVGSAAKAGLGRKFREYVARSMIDKVEGWVETVLSGQRFWQEALESLGDVLQFDAEGLDPAVRDRVQALIDKLTPDDIEHRVRLVVTHMPWDYPCDERLEYEERNARQMEAVEEIAIELLNSPDTLTALLPRLCTGEQRQTANFGEFVAQHAEEPKHWLDASVKAYLATPREERNFSLIAGVASGLRKRSPELYAAFKQEAATSNDLAICLPFTTLRAGIEDDDIELVCSAIDAGVLDSRHLMNWTTGGELAKREPRIVKPLLQKLLRGDGDSYSVGLDVMGMYVYRDSGRLSSLRSELILAAENASVRGKKNGSQMDSHHFKELMNWILDLGPDDSDACKVASSLAEQIATAASSIGDDHIVPLLPKLLSQFPEIVWPYIGKAISESREVSWYLQLAFGDRHAFDDKEKPPILHLPEEMLFAWCNANPDVGPEFLAGVVPVLANRDREAVNHEFHPLTKRLLEEFGNREDVQRALFSNIHTFGWSGSVTTYFRLFEEPLASLQSHENAAVRRWGKRALESIQKSIKNEQDRDDEQHAHWVN